MTTTDDNRVERAVADVKEAVVTKGTLLERSTVVAKASPTFPTDQGRQPTVVAKTSPTFPTDQGRQPTVVAKTSPTFPTDQGRQPTVVAKTSPTFAPSRDGHKATQREHTGEAGLRDVRRRALIARTSSDQSRAEAPSSEATQDAFSNLVDGLRGLSAVINSLVDLAQAAGPTRHG